MHVTALWDLTYILETASRISLGQFPYRDFPLPHAPLTFIVNATIIKLFGRQVLNHYLYSSVVSGVASVLTWRILLHLFAHTQLPPRVSAFMLSVPLIFLGIGSILSFPFYDSDCTLSVLICIWLLLRAECRHFPAGATFISGLLVVVPAFFKQNAGLPFLLSTIVCIAYFGIRNRRASILLLAGVATGFASALTLIYFTAGLRNYDYWTVQFASSRRLSLVPDVLRVYGWGSGYFTLFWAYMVFVLGPALFLLCRRKTRPAARWLAAMILALPFLVSITQLFLPGDATRKTLGLLHVWPVWLITSLVLAVWRLPRMTALAQLLPFVLFATAQGALLSNLVAGSSFALWPILLLLIATSLEALAPIEESNHWTVERDWTVERQEHTGLRSSTAPLKALTAVASFALLVTGSYYAISHVRLYYADLTGDALLHSKLPALRGLAMKGNWIPDFEELVDYTDREIPRGDGILIFPGEDLFYFTTGRTPKYPVLQFDGTINPYDAVEIARIAHERDIHWLVVKQRLQILEPPFYLQPELIEPLSQDFALRATLKNYAIYYRK